MKHRIKIIICILLGSLNCQLCFCQEFERVESNTRNVGSVKSIGGRTLVLVVYATYEDSTNFSESDKQKVKDAVKKAIDWICEQSMRYGKKEFFTFAYERMELKVSRNENINMIEPKKAIERLYGESYLDMIKTIANNHNCNNYMIMMCTEEKTVSHCYAAYAPFHLYYTEGCVININGGGVLETKIAHEVLHAFGAWDLYEFEDTSGKQVSLYRKDNNTEFLRSYLSNSIMTFTGTRLVNLKLDELTAYLIGLTNEKQWWFDVLSKNGAR